MNKYYQSTAVCRNAVILAKLVFFARNSILVEIIGLEVRNLQAAKRCAVILVDVSS
jgi:hypothetical protein